MTYDDTDSPIPHSLFTLSDDLTGQSVQTITSATLSPNHPAAELKRLNDSLLSLLHDAGDQTTLLYRQSYTMDGLFHLLIKHGLSPVTEEGAMENAMPKNNFAKINPTPSPFHSDERTEEEEKW